LKAFPRDLAKAVINRWDQMVSGDYITPPRPPDRLFRELLEIAYICGGLPEENRYPQFNIVAVPISDAEKNRYVGDIWYFNEPRTLSIDEIRRLAPVVDFKKSGILVKWDSKKLQVAGLVDFGTSWSRARIGLQYHYQFPNCLFIQLDRPGRIKVYQGQYLVAALVDGQLDRHKGLDLNLTLHDVSHRGLSKIWRAIKPPKEESGRDYESFLFISFWNIFGAMANCISEAGHGGAIVIVPKHKTVPERQIRIKYRQNSSILREAYISFMNVRNRVIDFVIRAEGGDESKKGEWARAELQLSECHLRLVEAVRFVARLSGCDGAIVISNDLQLLGFGAEIRADLKPNTEIREIENEMRRTFRSLDVEQFGQRHRSAIKLVSQRPDCLVVVISQDGPISVVRSESHKFVDVKKGANFANMNMPFA
jgi:hypothetical protein